MISLHSPAFLSLNQLPSFSPETSETSWVDFSLHQYWNHQNGWKNTLNNLRLIVQPLLLFWLISPWLDVFPNTNLLLGFHQLISVINAFKPFYFYP